MASPSEQSILNRMAEEKEKYCDAREDIRIDMDHLTSPVTSVDGKTDPSEETPDTKKEETVKIRKHGHSFSSSMTEVKFMEDGLLDLLSSFNSGELRAFGKGNTLEQMEAIRAKQEKLAKLHFDIGATKGQSETTNQNWMCDSDQTELVAGLRELSLEIEKLHDATAN